MFTVCVLCYGDHPDLAGRCLGSVARSADWSLVADVRVGLNEISRTTRLAVRAFARGCPRPVVAYEEEAGRNVYKYPLMRRMLYDPARPPAGRVMWFDDDSFVKDESGPAWWRETAEAARQPGMLGSVYVLNSPFTPAQRSAIARQPWYAGRPVDPPHVPSFVTGGWWVADPAFLAAWDWPFPELAHNGGDAILGEVCRQQGVPLRRHNKGVAINYDKARGGESGAVRRGAKTSGPWSGPPPAGLHDFEVTATTLPGAGDVR
jgi:hypothetical protein